ncbi:hypothetical protein K443DRAFT_124936 [Laccaria amethystina LaAM-08-1]|uniref:Uncharacterized protein n=1 Tax=Laccaria amethystina LaAM-08-1 TaxID=1095629 RepID=A0A0C9WTB7_9AGAR|nr:hypothetical protein K443DRAFT_124936 [Laccaria amethystina LaAM-08-1]
MEASQRVVRVHLIPHPSAEILGPLFQNLKQAAAEEPRVQQAQAYSPRTLILAPTHKLSCQLSGFAKSLLYNAKLRVLCASKANAKNMKERGEIASKMAAQFETMVRRLMGMVRGRGWDRKEGEEEENEEEGGRRQGGREIRWLGLASGGVNLTWVWRVWSGLSLMKLMFSLIPNSKQRLEHSCPTSGLLVNILSMPISYPFSLVLTSATIPTAYLENGHPSLIRFASPWLQQLPQTLRTEYVSRTEVDKFVDIERRIRRVWVNDSLTFHRQAGHLSKAAFYDHVVISSGRRRQRACHRLQLREGSRICWKQLSKTTARHGGPWN